MNARPTLKLRTLREIPRLLLRALLHIPLKQKASIQSGRIAIRRRARPVHPVPHIDIIKSTLRPKLGIHIELPHRSLGDLRGGNKGWVGILAVEREPATDLVDLARDGRVPEGLLDEPVGDLGPFVHDGVGECVLVGEILGEVDY